MTMKNKELEFVNQDGELMTDNTEMRLNDLLSGLKIVLKTMPATLTADKKSLAIQFQDTIICRISVEDEGYKIYNVVPEWAERTSYHCDFVDDGSCFYYLETIDECIGEVQRQAIFKTQKEGNNLAIGSEHTSELSRIVTPEAFEDAFKHFIEQADKNAKTKKAQGTKVPYGFSEKPKCDGAQYGVRYGQGAPSASPYMNWWVVSIYYLPKSGDIILGIEEDRYHSLKKMEISPLRYTQIGNKKNRVAVFYSSPKIYVNYRELYEKFIQVCEEVMRLGL